MLSDTTETGTADRKRFEHVEWTLGEEAEFLKILLEQKELGNQNENGWKPSVWETVVKAMAERFPQTVVKKLTKHCKPRWQRLKRQYRIIKSLREHVGFTWDDRTGMISAAPDAWEKYIEVHEEAKPFRKKPFAHFDILALLTDDTPPVVGSRSLSQAPVPVESLEEVKASGAGVSAAAAAAAAGAEDSEEEEDPSDSDSDNTNQSKGKRRASSPPPPPRSRKRKSSAAEVSFSSSVYPAATSSQGQSSHPTKRARHHSYTHGHGGQRPNTDILFVMANTMEMLATVFTSRGDGSSSIAQPPSQRKAKAFQIAEQEEALSEEELLKAADIFERNIDVTEIYLAFRNKALRRQWLKSKLGESSSS